MKVSEGIRARYSCRSYSDKPVSREKILKLLELANWAPSASNKQNRQFVVITDKQDREWLAAMNSQPQLAEAPVVLLITGRMGAYFKDKDDYLKGLKSWEMKASSELLEWENMMTKWMVSDAAAAVENLMLAATEAGLATCWLGIMDFAGVKQKFGLPPEETPICLVTLGFEKTRPTDRTKRKEIEKLVHWGKF